MQTLNKSNISLLMLSLLICTGTYHTAHAYEDDFIHNFATFHFEDNGPVTTEIDVRVSLWGLGIPQEGEIDVNGAIVTSSEYYGNWQHVIRLTPDINGTFGINVFNEELFPNLPEIFGYNAFLQVEFKYPHEPDNAYRLLDMISDSPDKIKRWLLVESLTCLDPWLKHIGTVTNEFTIDADGNSGQFVKLFFGGNSEKALVYDILSNWFNINSRFNINGFSGIKLAINAHANDSNVQLFSIRNSSGQAKFYVDENGSTTTTELTIPSSDGSTIRGHYSILATNVTSANIPAGQCNNYSTINLTNAQPGQTVLATPVFIENGIETTHLSWNAFSGSSGSVTIRACNPSSNDINTADQQSWRIDIWVH